MKAKVIYTDGITGAETITVGIHQIQYGSDSGGNGDGFCYNCQSFDCELTDEEKDAVNNAKRE